MPLVRWPSNPGQLKSLSLDRIAAVLLDNPPCLAVFASLPETSPIHVLNRRVGQLPLFTKPADQKKE